MTIEKKYLNILNRLSVLSLRATGLSSPNPPVACVITDLDGNILSEGHTQKAGGNHAEKEAYSKLENKEIPHNVYVTLEPCTHFGRTPPCVDLILKYKPKNVFYGLRDPNPIVKKNDGLKQMQEIGIQPIQLQELKQIAESFFDGFLSRIKYNSPAYIIKTAVSKEGYFKSDSRLPFRLTSVESDRFSQIVRSKIDAIVVGPATVYFDQPGLDFRGNCRIENKNIINDKSLFWKSLIDYSNDDFMQRVSIEDNNPYRVFLLSNKCFPEKCFFEKQKAINERLSSDKSIFLLLDDDKPLYNINHFQCLKTESSNIYKNISEILFNLTCNNVIIEGGNMLYTEFFKNLNEYDSFLKIETSTILENGHKPNIDSKDLSLNFQAKIGDDVWKLFQL